MMERIGNGFWKTVATHAVTAMITGAAAWMSFGGGISESAARQLIRETSINRDDVTSMIENQSPYVRDKQAIAVRLSSIEKWLEKIDAKIK